jgi:mutator protein MutT
MTPPILDVGAALIVRNGQYLVTQRMEGDSFGGYWELPGGKKEPGETMAQCVAREIKEELGVEVTPVKFFRMASYAYPQRTVRLHIYLCRLVSGEPEAIECQAFEWTDPARLPTFRFPDADLSLVYELSRVYPETLFDTTAHPPEYLEGVRLFNAGEYFEAHEVWEVLWHEKEGEEKLFLQSLIQAAVALRHHQTSNLPGLKALTAKATEKWGQLPELYWGLDLKTLREGLEGFVRRVDAAVPAAQGSLKPGIHLTVRD